MFADCFAFGDDVFGGNREVPIADPSLSYAQIRSRGFIDNDIERNRKAYQFLRTALSSEVDRGILLRANSLTEAWRNIESWHNPKSISANQALYDRFRSYFMEARAKPPCCPYCSGEDGISTLTTKSFHDPKPVSDPISLDPARIRVRS